MTKLAAFISNFPKSLNVLMMLLDCDLVGGFRFHFRVFKVLMIFFSPIPSQLSVSKRDFFFTIADLIYKSDCYQIRLFQNKITINDEWR